MVVTMYIPTGIQKKLEFQAKEEKMELGDYCLLLLMKALPQKKKSALNADSFNKWKESDCLRIGNESWQRVRAQDVYRFYCLWCESTEQTPISIIAFSKLMASTGIPKARDNAGNFYWATCNSFEAECEALANGQSPPGFHDGETADQYNERRINSSSPDVQQYMRLICARILQPGERMPENHTRLWRRYKSRAIEMIAHEAAP